MRTWIAEEGRWTAAPPRHCLICDAELPRREGRGGPLRYCAEHAPVRRAEGARWYTRHREHCAAYQRAHDGSRPIVNRVCPCQCYRLQGLVCGASWTGWSAETRCRECRRSRHRTWPA